MIDWKTSLLTEGQRETLKYEGEEPAYPEKMHQRIRDRVYAGLRVDAPLLMKRLPAERRRTIFTKWGKSPHDKSPHDREVKDPPVAPPITLATNRTPEEKERGLFRDGIVNLLAFLYLGIEEGNVGEFGEMLEEALSRAARESHRTLEEFELEIEMSGVETLAPQEIARRVRDGDPGLTIGEVRLAQEKGHLDPEEVESYLVVDDNGE